jgi:hypothetical protein
MNLAYLGDALDHWKGSLFESLQQASVLRDFAVDAMASDWRSWHSADISLFAHLLRIQVSQVIPHEVDLSFRKEYFNEIRHRGDLFLDPDTGIATGKVKCISQYVKPSEIERLLQKPERVLAVYQHVRGQSVSGRVDTVCRSVSGAIGACHWVSYESGSVAMVFLSKSNNRTAEIAMHFAKVLGTHAARRIRTSDGPNHVVGRNSTVLNP